MPINSVAPNKPTSRDKVKSCNPIDKSHGFRYHNAQMVDMEYFLS